MTNEKFSPGPWRFDPLHNAVTGDAPSSRIRSSVIVARMPHEVEPHHAAYARVQANARLIAAAPALFEALTLIVRRCTCEEWTCPTCKVADAALSAARGESRDPDEAFLRSEMARTGLTEDELAFGVEE